jgi:hypothetical protein
MGMVRTLNSIGFLQSLLFTSYLLFGAQKNRSQLDLSEEDSIMPTPADDIKDDIKIEIRELIDLQIRVFGQPTSLTAFQLEDCHRRAERIRTLGQKLDQFGVAAIQRDGLWRQAS